MNKTPTPEIPTVPFHAVQHRIMTKWNPAERNPHHAIFGQNGTGKSYLIRHGILSLCPNDRILVIDVKGRDETWKGYGETIAELPARTEPRPYRLDLSLQNSYADKRRVVQDTFARVMDEGHWVLVIDEMRSITDPNRLALAAPTEELINVGRALGITCIMGTQSPMWAVPALKDQGGIIWLGTMRNRDNARKLANIAGFGPELAPVIESRPARSWLYVDAYEDEPLLGITSVPAAS